MKNSALSKSIDLLLQNKKMTCTAAAAPLQTAKFKKACRLGHVNALEARESNQTAEFTLYVLLQNNSQMLYVLATPEEKPRAWQSLDALTAFLRVSTPEPLPLKVSLKHSKAEMS